jgi:hypothetical protein
MSERRAALLNRLQLLVTEEPRVEGMTPCWIWQGQTDGRKGYPRISVNGVTVAAHRVSFVHYHGYIPPSIQVDHLCNVVACINPEHLEAVTNLQNQRRRHRRNRNGKSSKEESSKAEQGSNDRLGNEAPPALESMAQRRIRLREGVQRDAGRGPHPSGARESNRH